MTTLIITLPEALPTAATPCDSVLSADGRTVMRHVEAPMALLPAPTGVEIVAVVPVGRLSWHRLTLPPGTLNKGIFQEGNAPRLRSVLDGLLEDRVLDDPAQLHFAIAPQAQAGAPIWVAACDRAWLHAWLAALEQAGRPVAHIVPEMTPPAEEAGRASLHVIGNPDQAQAVLSGADGVSMLPLSVASAALIDWPEGAEVVAEPAVAALAEQYFKRPATLQTGPERWLLAAQSAWDMAQFDLLYTRRARTRKHLSALVKTLLQAPRWRAARWAALALVAVNLAGLQAWAWQEKAALAAKRAAIRDTLTATFPEVRVVVDAPLQMARALADLQRRSGTASSADLETMLAQYQTSVPDARAPSAIEFTAGELRLKGLDAASQGLRDAPTRLQARGYSARLDGDSLLIKLERQP
ncbi:type II secretion system protein GspL [Polaromonas sp.]|uniref:type II secretion system protein GspL n=1 Tax=Polaromonas sp. TaxID=1869339 RepID=UPI001DEFECD5|nr:type II secretion system protein GspL [Polaromonas sp.]MBT9477334.1 general secretion pathway protein GspL [Polaromonas sp.]